MEEANKGMQEWMNRAAKCGDNLVDMGTPLANGQKLGVGGGSIGSDRGINGYSILQAESMDHAKELLQGHPYLSGWNAACDIEVHEAMPLSGEM